MSEIFSFFQYFVWFSLTFPVCSKFPDFSLTGKCLPNFPGFPVRVGTLSRLTLISWASWSDKPSDPIMTRLSLLSSESSKNSLFLLHDWGLSEKKFKAVLNLNYYLWSHVLYVFPISTGLLRFIILDLQEILCCKNNFLCKEQSVMYLGVLVSKSVCMVHSRHIPVSFGF